MNISEISILVTTNLMIRRWLGLPLELQPPQDHGSSIMEATIAKT